MTRSWFFLLALTVAPLSARAASVVASSNTLNEIRFDQKLGASLPLDVSFYDENNHPVRLGSYFGRRPVVLVPVYYDCPMLCTLTLNGLLKALRALSFTVGREFDVVVFSIDPTETAALAMAKKSSYLEGYGRTGTEAGWHFLTGRKEAIDAVCDAIGFRYVFDPKSHEYAHAAGFVVATPQGRVSRYLYGTEPSARDLRLALINASSNKIGSPVDRILLYCYHYDPSTGKYSLAILRLVRIAGIVTVLAMAGAIVWLSRRPRRLS